MLYMLCIFESDRTCSKLARLRSIEIVHVVPLTFQANLFILEIDL